MAVLKMVTAKVLDLSLWDGYEISNGLFEVSDADWRTPDMGAVTGRCFRITSTGASGSIFGRVVLPSNLAEVYVRAAMKLNTVTNTQIPVVRFYDGQTLHVGLEMNPASGKIRALRSTTTTLQESAGSAFVPYSWFCLEAWVKIADSGGRVVVKVDGATVVDSTGDTRNLGNQWVDLVLVGFVGSTPIGTEMLLDDIMVRDDTWCGQGGIFLLAPNASGDASDWAKSDPTKADWECVNELPPSYNRYLYTPADTPGVNSLLNVQNLSITPTAITAVGALARARLSAPGSGAVKPLVKSGVQVVAGNTVALDVGERWATMYLTQNPDGNVAWNAAALEAVQVGVQSA